MNKSYLPFRIPWKPEEHILENCVATQTPSGMAFLPRFPNGDILKQRNNHTP
jgi:hypothetical protein